MGSAPMRTSGRRAEPFADTEPDLLELYGLDPPSLRRRRAQDFGIRKTVQGLRKHQRRDDDVSIHVPFEAEVYTLRIPEEVLAKTEEDETVQAVVAAAKKYAAGESTAQDTVAGLQSLVPGTSEAVMRMSIEAVVAVYIVIDQVAKDLTTQGLHEQAGLAVTIGTKLLDVLKYSGAPEHPELQALPFVLHDDTSRRAYICNRAVYGRHRGEVVVGEGLRLVVYQDAAGPPPAAVLLQELMQLATVVNAARYKGSLLKKEVMREVFSRKTRHWFRKVARAAGDVAALTNHRLHTKYHGVDPTRVKKELANTSVLAARILGKTLLEEVSKMSPEQLQNLDKFVLQAFNTYLSDAAHARKLVPASLLRLRYVRQPLM